MIKEFKKEELGELPYEAPEGWRIVSDTIVGHRRWSVTHQIVFQTPEQVGTNLAWRAHYEVGATESQDEAPWQYDDEVECDLVIEIEKTVKVWERAP